MWKYQIPELQDKMNFRIITYDLRGHGKSDVSDGQYTMELFVDDLIGLLDYLKIGKTIICGFSMGGYIALRAIERNPERFNALILCDTMPAPDSNEAKIRRANSLKEIKKEGIERFAEGFLKSIFAAQTFTTKPNILGETRKIILSNAPLGICGALIAITGRTDTTEALSKISVPTLILVGKHDAVTPPTAASIMHEKIGNSELQVIEDAAHMSNMENPTSFNRHLIHFLHHIVTEK